MLFIRSLQAFSSKIYKTLKKVVKGDCQYLLFFFCFYTSFFLFGNSNKVLLLIALIYLLIFYLLTHNFTLALWVIFISVLPFAKGKALEIPLIAKEEVSRYILFDLNYYFSVYLSDFFLLILAYLYLRKKIYTLPAGPSLNCPQFKLTVTSFFLFCLVALLKMLTSSFPNVIFFSVLQLFKLLVILLLAFKLINFDSRVNSIVTDAIASSLLFQSLWVILQKIKGGFLGRELEVILETTGRTISTVENPALARMPGTFYEPSILGTFLLMNLGIIIFAMSQYHLSKNKTIFYLITTGLGLIAIIFTGSRALYGLVLIAAFIIYRLAPKNLKKIIGDMTKTLKQAVAKHRPLAIFFLSGLIALLGLAVIYLIQRMWSFPTLLTKDGSAMYRIQLNLYATRLGFRNWLGTGLNLSPYELAVSFPNETYIFDPAHPHNIFFQILAETGVFGLSLFLLFLYFAFRPVVLKPQRLNQFSVGALLFLVCAQIYPIFLNHPEILSYLFLYLGFHFNQLEQNA